jgi:acylphosphatase
MNMRAHLVISGRVQGVGFRWFVYNIAASLRLAGWAKNLADGRVEAVFEGEKEAVETAISECYKGSRSAIVSGIDTDWDEKPEGFTSFDIRSD